MSNPIRPSAADHPSPHQTPDWSDPARGTAFAAWLQREAARHDLDPASVRVASADASFRRYFRVDRQSGASSVIVMDAPPTLENARPFVEVAALMQTAGLNVPQVMAWDEAAGFLLLTDLGTTTMMDAIDREHPQVNLDLYGHATDALVRWQSASRPGVLPPYDQVLLRRELTLFPDWYLARHRGVTLDNTQQETLDKAFDLIVKRCLASPSVYVHRDFMPRNLMLPVEGAADGAVGVLDFQDAVYGPISYDIASLMRDAFLSWEEDFVLDVTVRYWEKARKGGLMDFEDWHSDFGAFYRAVEWMGLQRHLKVAGIFARLTLRDGKPKYLADAPRFMAYIRATASRYRELGPMLKVLDTLEGVTETTTFVFGRF